jgi:hypothetical protein
MKLKTTSANERTHMIIRRTIKPTMSCLKKKDHMYARVHHESDDNRSSTSKYPSVSSLAIGYVSEVESFLIVSTTFRAITIETSCRKHMQKSNK